MLLRRCGMISEASARRGKWLRKYRTGREDIGGSAAARLSAGDLGGAKMNSRETCERGGEGWRRPFSRRVAESLDSASIARTSKVPSLFYALSSAREIARGGESPIMGLLKRERRTDRSRAEFTSGRASAGSERSRDANRDASLHPSPSPR